jgi:non-heme chloroperoxidase
MRRPLVILLAVLLTLTGHASTAPGVTPDISGTWQGTIEVGAQRTRAAWVISKDRQGAWQLLLYNVDLSSEPMKASAVSVDGTAVRVTVDRLREVYEGTLSPDRQSIAVTWPTKGGNVPVALHRATKRTAWQLDPSPHKVRFVTVDHDVSLEVLDWGGRGRPVVLLTGLGNNAHVYDQFAPKLTASYHVLAITRRGFGASSTPAGGYSADRLGDDVLEVLQALNISRPILVGHSIAGEELSSIGTRHPEKVAALIYLEAGYPYALYSGGDLKFDVDELRKNLDVLQKGDRHAAQELLATSLPRVTRDLETLPPEGSAPAGPAFIGPPPPAVDQAILAGVQKYSAISAVPILAIYSDDADVPDKIRASLELQVLAFKQAMPSAHVIRLAHASHYVFRSNEAHVLREMNDFIAGLPPAL